MQQIEDLTSQYSEQLESGEDVEILYSDSSLLKVKIVAKKLIKHQDEKNPHTEMPEGVIVYFYDRHGNIENTLSANYGIMYDNTGEMLAREQVVAQNVQNEKLETEELIWNEQKEKIYSDKFVKITTQDEVIYGDGFESNQDFTNYEIKKIKGQINLKEDAIL